MLIVKFYKSVSCLLYKVFLFRYEFLILYYTEWLFPTGVLKTNARIVFQPDSFVARNRENEELVCPSVTIVVYAISLVGKLSVGVGAGHSGNCLVRLI